ncbi:TOBE domain-containing protein, partial [Vibrio diabolicus]
DGSPREIYEEPKKLFVARFIGEINVFNATMLERIDDKRIRAEIEGVESVVYYDKEAQKGDKLQVLLRPEDLRIEEIKESEEKGIVGHVTERTYKGMTLDSVIQLDSGMRVMVSEFFNEDDPDVDHSLGQKVAITWVESWEVVLNDKQED